MNSNFFVFLFTIVAVFLSVLTLAAYTNPIK